jgi:hypothetical protein
MNKLFSIILLFLFTISSHDSIAQTWQYKLLGANNITKDMAIATVDNGYLYQKTSNTFFKLDQLGTVVQVFPSSLVNSFSAATKIDGSNTGYTIASSPVGYLSKNLFYSMLNLI